MAKISELPSTASLTGSEIVPIVQSSTTKSTLLSTIRSWLISLNTAFTGNVSVGGTLGVTGQASFSSDVALQSINSGYLYGNRVINGAQEIDQVNSGAAVTPAASAYLTDMFGLAINQASKITCQQVADAPAGLKNSLKVTVASQYAPAATDIFNIQTAIEGKDVIDFQLGTAGAATFTLSYWIKGSVAGTYAVRLSNAAGNRSYVGTVSVTTSWAQVKITLQGDITGTWATDNTVGLYLAFDLGSGSNFNTTAGSWQAGNFFRTAGSVTFVNQVAGSTLNITGVDCRPGAVAPTYFERRADEFQRCQRYYETGLTICVTNAVASPLTNKSYYKATKRATPTLVVTPLGGTGATWTTGTDMFYQTASHTTFDGANWTSSARLF